MRWLLALGAPLLGRRDKIVERLEQLAEERNELAVFSE